MCTGIKIDYDKGCVMGRTMDYEVPVAYNALYFPRAYKICEDLMGEAVYSKYKTLGVCFQNKDPLKDGVNEHGLIGITNEFTGFNLYSKDVNPDKVNLSSLDYFTYALGNYRSVEELIDDLPNIHLSSRNHKGDSVICPDFHFMFSDSTKRCVVIEPHKKELIYYDNPYNVMTNSPAFNSHIRRLNKHIDLDNPQGFNSAKDLPGGYDPVSRFIKAYYLTKMNVESKNYNEALSHGYNILSAMVMPDGFVRNEKHKSRTHTRYICLYDTENKLLTVKSHLNPTVYHLGFDDIVEEDKRLAFFIKEEFTSQRL